MSENKGFTSIETPIFDRPFRQRVQEGWQNFLQKEATLRECIDTNMESEAIMGLLDSILSSVFSEVYAEVGYNGEKYDLILNLEGDWSRLFPLVYFKNHAPGEVFEHWNILVGRQAHIENLGACAVRIYGESVSAEDLKVWIDWEEEGAKLFVYCPKFLPLLKDEDRRGEAYWISYILLDYAIGELAEMKYISGMEVIETPLAGESLSMEQLLPLFMDKLSLRKEELSNPDRYCELYSAYRMEPDRDATDGLRRDVFAGSGCFIPVLNEFWNGETRIIETFQSDGIETGYFCYPLYGFEGENRGEQILDFRDYVVAQLEEKLGADSFTFIGGASGIYYGYIDFIAWDSKAVIDAALEVFKETGIDWVMYHSFRQDVDGVTILEK